jgi:arylsulfatase A-like enzyme
MRALRREIGTWPSAVATYPCLASLALSVLSCTAPDSGGGASETLSPARPDIVLIMADDMGYSDLGSYGSEIRTPNLDELAANGLRYHHFYNQARCMPTRAALLTGRYPHQTGLGEMQSDRGLPGYRGNINHTSVTVAEALEGTGYRSYVVGKWHLTGHDAPDEPEENRFNWPLQRGFDRFYGTIQGAGSFFAPTTLTWGNENIDEGRVFPGVPWAPPADARLPVKDDGAFYYTDAINETSARFIREHHRDHPGDPFFLYVGHVAPHWPLHAYEEDYLPYLDLYRQGWDEVRRQRHERMIEMGVVDPRWPLPDRPSALPAWDHLTMEDLPEEVRAALQAHNLDIREEMALRMAIHAAMVERMDRGIARIVQALRDTGRFENTLVLFLSDNGAAAEWGTYGFGWPRLELHGVPTGGPQSYASVGVAWAHVANAPFRLWKTFNHEGGAATPFIAHWPAGIGARGEWRAQIGHIIDVLPTLLDVTGSAYPTEYGGHRIEPYEGVSLVPSFRDEPLDREDLLYFEHLGRRAVRDGRWKLVTSEAGIDGRWKLYDMETDRFETRDLAAEHPDRVRELAARWQRWAERANVLPMIPDQR